jgi:hypothetical protein
MTGVLPPLIPLPQFADFIYRLIEVPNKVATINRFVTPPMDVRAREGAEHASRNHLTQRSEAVK